MKKILTATVVARMAGCSRSTVLNYSKNGVLCPVILSDKTRAYDDDDVDLVRAALGSKKRKQTEVGET